MNTIPLFKERGIGEAISDTITYLQNEKQLLGKMFSVILPIYVIVGVIAGYATKDISGVYIEMLKELAAGNLNAERVQEMLQQVARQNTGGMAGVSTFVSIIGVVMHGMLASFTYNYVKERELQGQIADETLNTYLTKDLGWYIGYSFLLGLVMVGIGIGFTLVVTLLSLASQTVGAILMIIGVFTGIYLVFMYFILFFPVCFLEDRKFGDALSRSITLMKGHFWETFFFSVITGIVIWLFSLLASAAMGFVGGLMGTSMAAIFAQTTQYAISGVTGVAMIVAYSLWYGNLRNQLEGITSLGGYDTLIEEIGKKDFE